MIRVPSKENTKCQIRAYGPRSYMLQESSFACFFFLVVLFWFLFLIYMFRISCIYTMYFIHIRLSYSPTNTFQTPQHISFPTSSCPILPLPSWNFYLGWSGTNLLHVNHRCWEFISTWPCHIQRTVFDSTPQTYLPALTFFPTFLLSCSLNHGDNGWWPGCPLCGWALVVIYS